MGMNFLSGKAIYTTSSYPHTARDGSCKTGTDSNVRISGYVGLAKTESALLTGLNTQAVSVIVYADSSFQSYKSGVINAPTTCNLNHGVLATGYTSEYIKIKNSWGTSWGEAGYIRVKRSTSGADHTASTTARTPTQRAQLRQSRCEPKFGEPGFIFGRATTHTHLQQGCVVFCALSQT